MEKTGVITVKQNCSAYIARFMGKNVTASSTEGRLQAAHKVADKVLGDEPYELKPVIGQNAFNVMQEVSNG